MVWHLLTGMGTQVLELQMMLHKVMVMINYKQKINKALKWINQESPLEIRAGSHSLIRRKLHLVQEFQIGSNKYSVERFHTGYNLPMILMNQ